jgi:hypothetical protein
MSEIKICLECGLVGIRDNKDNEIKKIKAKKFLPSKNKCCNCGSEDVINVDEEIAPYIYMLNKIGLTTRYSCAGHVSSNYRTAYILFDNDEYYDKVIDIIKKSKNRDLYAKFIEIERLNKYDIKNMNTGKIETGFFTLLSSDYIPKDEELIVKHEYAFIINFKPEYLILDEDQDYIILRYNAKEAFYKLIDEIISILRWDVLC